MANIDPSHPLILSALLFAIGVSCVLLRRNLIVMLMGIELMLNSANLAFVTFSNALHSMDGQIYAFFVIAVAGAEAAVGLAIVVAVFRLKGTISSDEIDSMKW